MRAMTEIRGYHDVEGYFQKAVVMGHIFMPHMPFTKFLYQHISVKVVVLHAPQGCPIIVLAGNQIYFGCEMGMCIFTPGIPS